jgi:AcrR family transcriptional regulator
MSKKQLIMEKSLDLFARQGFEATSVQQITSYCGISKGAFYLAFKSKDELIIALIDHFMKQITMDIDYTVRNTNKADTLYYFYHTLFTAFLKHSKFAKLLMKEQTQPLNEELLSKMRYYDNLVDQSILAMVEKTYGHKIEAIKYDLVYTVKGLMNSYSTLFLFNTLVLNVELVSKSLVEKTNILANHMSVPFITTDLIKSFKNEVEDISKESLAELLSQNIEELDESIEKESLLILKEQLLMESYSLAIVKGMLENIRNHPDCKWISYLLRKYFQL